MLKIMQAPIIFGGSKPNDPYAGLAIRKATKRIVIHHSDSDPMTTVEQIHQWHLNKNPPWAGIGYNYVIQGDGTLWQGRPRDRQGAHTYNYNSDSIGICVCGKFMEYSPTEAQMQTLAEAIKEIRREYGQDVLVQGHRDLNATACPGDLFPWQELLNRLAQPVTKDLNTQAIEAGLITEPHNLKENATVEFVLITELNLLNKIERGK